MTIYEQEKQADLIRLSKLTVSYPCLNPVALGVRWLSVFKPGVNGSHGSSKVDTGQGLSPMSTSEASLRRVWQNPEDSVYDNL